MKNSKRTRTPAEGVKVFRKELRAFFRDLESHNDYRQKLVIPKAMYKGLAWGMYWSALRILGEDDKDTIRAQKKVTALMRLNKKKERHLRGLLRRILSMDRSSRNYVLAGDFEAMKALYNSEAYNSF